MLPFSILKRVISERPFKETIGTGGQLMRQSLEVLIERYQKSLYTVAFHITYETEDGSESGYSGGGVAIEEDGTQRNLTEQEIMEHLTMPEVEYEEDGTVWVYYYDQKLEITDLFQNGVCYVKLDHGGEILYLTVKYDDGYTVSSEKYIS